MYIEDYQFKIACTSLGMSEEIYDDFNHSIFYVRHDLAWGIEYGGKLFARFFMKCKGNYMELYVVSAQPNSKKAGEFLAKTAQGCTMRNIAIWGASHHLERLGLPGGK